jgi:hypothetical protein
MKFLAISRPTHPIPLEIAADLNQAMRFQAMYEAMAAG